MKRPVCCRTLLSLALASLLTQPAWAKRDLTELSLEDLLNVTVVGAAKYVQRQEEVAAAASVITRNEIKAFGWRTLDEALATLPGIHVSYDRQYSYIGTRGFGVPGDFNTRILLTINGNRANDVVYDGAASGRDFPLDMDLIERIEYIPGPGGAVYGQNALFGVVNVVTRTGAGVNGTEVGLAYQDLNSARDGRFTWGKKLDNGLDVLVSASGHRSRGEDHFYEFPGASDVDPLWPDSGVARGMNGTKGQQLFASFARGPWFFDFAYGDNRKDDPTAQYFSEPLVPGQYQRDKTLQTQLQYQDSFAGDTLQLTGRLFLGRQRYTGLFYYADSPYLATGSSDWQGAELRLLSTRWAGHKLMLGLEMQENTRRDQTNLSLVDPANNLVIPGTGWRAGMFVQDEWALNNSLSATLGLRFDRSSVAGNTLSPRAALIWLAAPSTTMKALYGRAHRAPNAYERDYDDVGTSNTQVANPGLGGEMVDTLELVVDQRVGRDLSLRGSLYRWNMRDLVVLGTDPGTGLSQYQSGGDVEATGIELSANKTWDWGGRLRGSLSHQEVAYKSGARLENSPQLLGKLNFSGPLPATGLPGLRFGAEVQYASKRLTRDGTELDAYWLANLHLSTDTWAKGLELSLGLYNLFDRRYAHPGSDINYQNSILQDGRSARLKAIFRF